MKKIKQILKVLGYILGGTIFSVLILGGIILLVLLVFQIAAWFSSYKVMSLIFECMFGIFFGGSIFFIGLAFFDEFVRWIKRKLKIKSK